MEQIFKIAGFIWDSLVHIWPYLLITIPLAVAVQISGAAKLIKKALTKRPFVSIILATIVGAFSPFCSCGVIPIVASLLIGGVPIAPVMSFWIASPSMDPEIFFLSTATIGWKLSVWRLIATFALSLLSGFITHYVFQKGMLGNEILKENQSISYKKSWDRIVTEITNLYIRIFKSRKAIKKATAQYILVDESNIQSNINCCISVNELSILPKSKPIKTENSCDSDESCNTESVSFRKKILIQTWKATVMVAKFMTLAFFINALIQFYLPQDFISKLLGGSSSFTVIIAAVIGIPVYTSNMTALPLISGLLTLGMNHGAALAFLISGPVTTLPAMAAVWGIVRKKIFFLYISFALIGAIIFGLLFNLIN